MLAKYASPCAYCGEPVKPGRDEYDYETKVSWHLECKEHADSQPDPKQRALADRLGYITFEPELSAWGLLRLMHRADRG